MRKLLTVGLLVILSCGKAVAAPNYVLGVEALNYYPHYSNEGGQYNGFARELFDSFAKTKGYSFEYRALPVARLYESFFAGELDFKYPDNLQWQDAKRKELTISYSDPVVSYTDGVLVLPANKGKGVEQLKQLGTVRGFTPWDYLGMVDKGQIKLQEVNSFQQSLLQGINNRVNGVYMNAEVGRYQLNTVLKQPDALVFDEALPNSKGFYTLSTTKHAKVIDEFNQFLKEHSAEVTAMKAKYGLQ
ncbi:MAG: transporter substrate-binding domain-containing protein [Pseudomonas sp.]|uniref:transporter substrate-binding domain-containing protein n=1 Tax=Pseudomonas sp. TaxID=306 RepID=UPI0027355A09|nr:transporter substrate-binding domain-containing protein [Pseudomonas sp.]MDP3847680.1 transporter substrate-binding domain-containing protein [Pseudomonas sp.]